MMRTVREHTFASGAGSGCAGAAGPGPAAWRRRRRYTARWGSPERGSRSTGRRARRRVQPPGRSPRSMPPIARSPRRRRPSRPCAPRSDPGRTPRLTERLCRAPSLGPALIGKADTSLLNHPNQSRPANFSVVAGRLSATLLSLTLVALLQGCGQTRRRGQLGRHRHPVTSSSHPTMAIKAIPT